MEQARRFNGSAACGTADSRLSTFNPASALDAKSPSAIEQDVVLLGELLQHHLERLFIAGCAEGEEALRSELYLFTNAAELHHLAITIRRFVVASIHFQEGAADQAELDREGCCEETANQEPIGLCTISG